jgi:hypothetical protein
MPRTSQVTDDREDFSRFVVHLTRDDRASFTSGGATARKNFVTILKERRIGAFKSHCLHHKKVDELSNDKIKKAFNVACFTEVPINQLRLLVGEIPGRDIELEPYGFVFTREFLVKKGAQPAIYVNSYGRNMYVREAVDAIFDNAVRQKFTGRGWRLLPFVNAMHERYDFTWEREWRVQGDVKFAVGDLVCAILPPDEDDIREVLGKAGVAAISPNWTYERIVEELASQQKKVTLKLKSLLPKNQPVKTSKEVRES